jgi:hypothetical protein
MTMRSDNARYSACAVMVAGPRSRVEGPAAGVPAAGRIIPAQRAQPGSRSPCYRPDLGRPGPVVIRWLRSAVTGPGGRPYPSRPTAPIWLPIPSRAPGPWSGPPPSGQAPAVIFDDSDIVPPPGAFRGQIRRCGHRMH